MVNLISWSVMCILALVASVSACGSKAFISNTPAKKSPMDQAGFDVGGNPPESDVSTNMLETRSNIGADGRPILAGPNDLKNNQNPNNPTESIDGVNKVGSSDRNIFDPSGKSQGAESVSEKEEFDRKFNILAFPQFLFIFDNSCSMEKVLRRTTQDFVGLLKKGDLFPPSSKVAVMTTMIGDDADLNKVHKRINSYSGIESEPGFLDFVDRAAIDRYKRNGKVDDSDKQRYPSPGCKDAWFKPDNKGADGKYCFAAALQSASRCVNVEAGARAFDQLLKKHESKKDLFIAGGTLQVVFVSDTHDSGRGSVAPYPGSAKLLREKAEKTQKVGEVTFHAIAAKGKTCSFGEGTPKKKVYYDLAKESGGNIVDSCAKNLNFKEFLEDTVEGSKVSTVEVFKLGKNHENIYAVAVDGKLTKNFSIDSEKNTIKVGGLAEKSEVTVFYSE